MRYFNFLFRWGGVAVVGPQRGDVTIGEALLGNVRITDGLAAAAHVGDSLLGEVRIKDSL